MRSRGWDLENADVIQCYPVSSGDEVVSRCRLDPVKYFVICFVESVAQCYGRVVCKSVHCI